VAGRSIIHFGEVATKTAKTATTAASSAPYLGYVPQKWSQLAAFSSTASPGFSFAIPSSAYTGQNFYVGFTA